MTLETEVSVANSSTHLIWDRKVEGGFPGMLRFSLHFLFNPFNILSTSL